MKASHQELEPKLIDHSMRAALEDPYSAVNEGYIKLQGDALRYLDLPSERKRRTSSQTEADKMESYSVLDQGGLVS
jgi:hypothetical protein